MSAKISDPSTSDYATKLIVDGLDSAMSWTWPKALVVVRSNIIIASPSGIFWLYRTDTEAIWKQYDLSGSLMGAVPETAHDCLLGIDNLNVWYATCQENFSTDSHWVAFKLPMAMFSKYLIYISPKAIGSIPQLTIDSEQIITTQMVGGKLHFDGRDMELVTRSGWIYRIASPGLRG
jgi:hypothetical protein